MQYWQDLSLDFMSEESDDPNDSNCLIVHKLPWLSESECEQILSFFLVHSAG